MSQKEFDNIFKLAKIKPLQSIQKFHRLTVEGLKGNGIDITTITARPVTGYTHTGLWWRQKEEVNHGIRHIYLPILNLRFIKNIIVAIMSFIQTLIWCFKSDRKCDVVVCDVLNYSVMLGAFFATKVMWFKSCAIVTDLPSMIISRMNISLFLKLIDSVTSNFSSYILLTDAMSPMINKKNRPYIVMEGLVDKRMEDRIVESTYSDNRLKHIIYAGGIYEKYGVKMLIDAFVNLDVQGLELHIYGSGDMEHDMPRYEAIDCRVKYHGVQPNAVVVEHQLKAMLLVNPRFTNDAEYTKYSFPSKNMEYMVSGTPVLTTNLPGMPAEYHEYVYILENETTEALTSKLRDISSRSWTELLDFGCSAQGFVLNNKNNYIQAKCIKSFFKTLYNRE